jgi:Signal transduction histidine kinase regulating citrate/malate metabolism
MNLFIDAIQLHLIASLPQAYITWLFVFSFLRPQPNRLLVRVLLLAWLHAIYTDSLILFIPVYLQLANSILALFALVFLLFRELELRTKLFVIAGIILISSISDILSIVIATNYLGVPDIESARREYLPDFLTVLYPQLLAFAVAGWYIRNQQSKQPLKRLLSNVNQKKPLFRVFALMVFQFILIAMIVALRYSTDKDNRLVTTFLLYASIVVILSAIVFSYRLLTITRSEAIRSTQAIYVDDIQNMFTSVRGQRHDFLNHVQVIHSMAQMGKYEQLKAYTATLVHETREVSDIVNHAAPALAAFAQSKTTVALGYGIPFTCELPDRWNYPDSAINMLDMIKILGNLVDNAFDETRLLPAGERGVHVSIRTDEGGITLKVSNRGRAIDEETRSRIFQAGYSTKGDGHSGLGLAIIQERVRHYGGTLEIDSDIRTQMTTFTVRLLCEESRISETPA